MEYSKMTVKCFKGKRCEKVASELISFLELISTVATVVQELKAVFTWGQI